jgi:hypothetical protein
VRKRLAKEIGWVTPYRGGVFDAWSAAEANHNPHATEAIFGGGCR